MVAKDISKDSQEELPKEVSPMLKELQDVFLEDLPDRLPPLCDIQHAIDFVSGVTLPNLPHYMMNPTKHAELTRQVDELLRKGFLEYVCGQLSHQSDHCKVSISHS